MKSFASVVALLIVIVFGSAAYAQIKIGVYYTEHIEVNEEKIRTDIKDAFAHISARIGAVLVPAFFKKAPIATTLINGMIEGRSQGSRTTANGVLGDETLYVFKNSPVVHKDLVDVDFLVVLTPILFFEEPTRASIYDWSSGLANLGGRIALIEMNSEFLVYTLSHELGHLLGVPHTDRDVCGETNYLMCAKPHVFEETTIVKRLQDGNVIEFATIIKERLKEWVLDERYRTALENYLKKKEKP